MAFKKVDGSQVRNEITGRMYIVPYIRLSSTGDCSLSRGFLNKLDHEPDSIDFEYDEDTGEFRFKVGTIYPRSIKNGNFTLPSAVLRIITEKKVSLPKVTTVRIYRSAYFEPYLKEDGWWYAKFMSVIKPTDHWIKTEGK